MVQFIDRLGRDAIDTETIHRKLWKMGIRLLHAVYEGDFDNSAEGKLRVGIFANMAEYVRNRIRAGAGAGLNRKSDQGGFCGGPRPFGYRAEREEIDDQGKMHERGPTVPRHAAYTGNEIHTRGDCEIDLRESRCRPVVP